MMSAEKFVMLVSLNTNVPFPVFVIEYEVESIGASILYTASFVILYVRFCFIDPCKSTAVFTVVSVLAGTTSAKVFMLLKLRKT